jgi:CRP/FNR family transcriptional regulator, cyclic AMP receptor protein
MTGVAYQFDFTGLLKGKSARARRQVVQAGTVIFRQGDPAEVIYFLLSGKIKMSAVSTQGKEAIVTILEPDEFFGEACLLGCGAHLLNAAALVDSCVLKIPKDVARVWMGENVGFDEFLLTHVIRSRLRTEDQLLDRLFHSSEKRLA